MKILALFFILIAFVFSIAAQEKAAEKWTKIISPKGDLSLLVHGDFLVDNEAGEYHIYAYQNDVRMTLTVQNGSGVKSRIKSMRGFQSRSKAEVTQFELGDFIGDTYAWGNKEDDDGYFSMSIYAASSKAFYTITVSSKVKTNPILEKLLHSIRLDKMPLIKQENPANLDAEPGVSLDSLKTSAVVLEALKKKDSKKTKVIYSDDEDEKKPAPVNYSRPIFILRKAWAKYTDNGRESGISGTVTLRIVFRADGEIGEITVLKKLPGGLTESAVEASRKIKFLPAEIDGKAVDTTRTVSYTFTIY